jgi:protein-disulfide isomerase
MGVGRLARACLAASTRVDPWPGDPGSRCSRGEMGNSDQPESEKGTGGAGNQPASRLNWRKPAIAFLAVVILGAIGVLLPRPSSQAGGSISLADEPSLGPADAPVTIIEYGDFGCTTCRGWYRQGVLEQILSYYGTQVRFVWRDFPIITAASPQAAEAGQCAFDQGRFWEYHDLLYDRAPALSIKDLKAYAAELGLDTAQFDSCLDSGVHRAKVEASTKEAYSHGFVATPAFLVNDQPIVGPQPFEIFKGIVDPILASAG